MMNPGPEHMRVHRPEPGPFAHGLHPAVIGTPVQAAVLAEQDGTFPVFSDGPIDGARRAVPAG
jgi:hypothetical protein